MIRRLRQSSFVQNIITLMSGGIAAQLIAVGTAPIITRLFSPENFGLLALYVSIIAVLTKISSLCYERAILLPKEDRAAVNVLALAMLILLTLVSLLVLVLLEAGNEIVSMLGNKELENWLFMLPLGMLVVGLTNIATFWALRRKRFRWMAASQMLESVTGASLKIALGLVFAAGAGGLLLGQLAGSIAALSLLGAVFLREPIRQLVSLITWSNIKKEAARYKSFPLFSSWNALLTVVGDQMIVILFAFWFTPAAIGFYSLSARLLKQPITTVSQTIARVYFQYSAEKVADRHLLAPGLVKLVAILALLGLLPFGLLWNYGELIFSFIFGESWLAAGRYTELMVPWFFVLFVQAPAGIIYEVCQSQHYKLWINISQLTLAIAAAYWAYSQKGTPEAVIELYVWVSAVMGSVQVVVAYWVAIKHDRITNREVSQGA